MPNMKEIGHPNTARPRCKATYPPASTLSRKLVVRCRKKAGPSGFCRECEPKKATVMP